MCMFKPQARPRSVVIRVLLKCDVSAVVAVGRAFENLWWESVQAGSAHWVPYDPNKPIGTWDEHL